MLKEDHKFIFLDTNIFLHFQFFTDIDWAKLVGVKSVTLVIPSTVINANQQLKKKETANRQKSCRI
jgi:hypothetical protein